VRGRHIEKPPAKRLLLTMRQSSDIMVTSDKATSSRDATQAACLRRRVGPPPHRHRPFQSHLPTQTREMLCLPGSCKRAGYQPTHTEEAHEALPKKAKSRVGYRMGRGDEGTSAGKHYENREPRR
jgi:hypothetical protein